MKPKRKTLRDLRTIDLNRGTDFVRELEMEVDVIPDQGAVLQFWKDAGLYSIYEAILYLENGTYPDLGKLIRTKWTAIEARIDGGEANEVT